MNDQEVRQKLSEIVCEVTKQDFVMIDDRADLVADVGADSMDLIDIVDRVEEKFKLAFDEKNVPTMRTMERILVAIRDAQDGKD